MQNAMILQGNQQLNERTEFTLLALNGSKQISWHEINCACATVHVHTSTEWDSPWCTVRVSIKIFFFETLWAYSNVRYCTEDQKTQKNSKRKNQKNRTLVQWGLNPKILFLLDRYRYYCIIKAKIEIDKIVQHTDYFLFVCSFQFLWSCSILILILILK